MGEWPWASENMHSQVWVAETGRLCLACRQSLSLNWSKPGWPSSLLFHYLRRHPSTHQSRMLPVRLHCSVQVKEACHVGDMWSPTAFVLSSAFAFAGTFILLRCVVTSKQWLLEEIVPPVAPVWGSSTSKRGSTQSQELARQAGSCSTSCPCAG